MEEKKEYFPNWSTSDKIENAENLQKYANSVLKSTKTKTALSLSFGAAALAGALTLVATGVGALPAAIVGGVGLVTSATGAIVQKVKSNHAKDVLLFSNEEMKVLKQIEVLEMGEPFQELDTNNDSMSYADYLKTVHVVFFDPNGEYGPTLNEIGEKAMKFREEHLEELEGENPLYTMFYFGDDPYEQNEEESFDQNENNSVDSNQTNIFEEFAPQTQENESDEKSPKLFKKHDRTKNC